ncbi:DUF2459 domain-containing protein [Aquimarina sp. 2304DJ70-9]|uniref:DUF2459 domain-containing protein n=1 Tax=Aquimarina penaris TaxID=3231044 RepID=UPI0034631205
MRLVKNILKCTGVVLIFPIAYFVLSVIFTYITVNKKANDVETNQSIYLGSKELHLEIIIPKTELDTTLLNGLKYNNNEKFLSFGWGDKTYYSKTSTSSNFTIINKCQAAFTNTSALLHVTRYSTKQNDWVEIKMTPSQLIVLQTYINNTFKNNNQDQKIIIPGLSYSTNDNFYEANGNYNCFNTCNTWINTGLKQSNAMACLWTPFDFGLLRIYKN